MGKFCFVKFKDKEGLVPANLTIPTEYMYRGIEFGTGMAIREELDKGPVDIVRSGKVIGRVNDYKIVRNRLKYIDEYFDPEDQV